MGSKTKQIKDSDGQDKSSREAMGMEARQNEGEDKRKHEEDKEKSRGEDKEKASDAVTDRCAPQVVCCARLELFVARPPQIVCHVQASTSFGREKTSRKRAHDSSSPF